MSRASGKTLRTGATLPEKSGPSLKTGFLVSAFKDSDDMTGKKTKPEDHLDALADVAWFLKLGYETVLVERNR